MDWTGGLGKLSSTLETLFSPARVQHLYGAGRKESSGTEIVKHTCISNNNGAFASVVTNVTRDLSSLFQVCVCVWVPQGFLQIQLKSSLLLFNWICKKLLFPVDRNTHKFFGRLQSNVFNAASLFQTTHVVTWYIEVHHVRPFFPCGVMTFSYHVMFIHNAFISGYCLNGYSIIWWDTSWHINRYKQINDTLFRQRITAGLATDL